MSQNDLRSNCTGGCRGKIRYISMRLARKSIFMAARRDPKRNLGPHGMSAFYCPNCGGFHIGRTTHVGRVEGIKEIGVINDS